MSHQLTDREVRNLIGNTLVDEFTKRRFVVNASARATHAAGTSVLNVSLFPVSDAERKESTSETDQR